MRPIEKDLYNFIQKKRIVTVPSISDEFGSGTSGLYSMYVPDAVTAQGLTDEVVDALSILRNSGSIFEVAVGKEFLQLWGGGILGDFPEARFKYFEFENRYKKYGYSGDWWLPTVYCSDEGAILLLKIILKAANGIVPFNYSRAINGYNQVLKHEKEKRTQIGANLSDIFYNRYPQLWNKTVKRIVTDYREHQITQARNKKINDFLKHHNLEIQELFIPAQPTLTFKQFLNLSN